MMSVGELLAGLPNGLHDARLAEVHYHLAERLLVLELEVWVGEPEALSVQAREVWRSARLTFRRVASVTLELPAELRPAERLGQPEVVSAELDYGEAPSGRDIPPGEALESVVVFRQEANCFLRFLAAGVDLQWLEEEPGYR